MRFVYFISFLYRDAVRNHLSCASLLRRISCAAIKSSGDVALLNVSDQQGTWRREFRADKKSSAGIPSLFAEIPFLCCGRKTVKMIENFLSSRLALRWLVGKRSWIVFRSEIVRAWDTITRVSAGSANLWFLHIAHFQNRLLLQDNPVMNFQSPNGCYYEFDIFRSEPKGHHLVIIILSKFMTWVF